MSSPENPASENFESQKNLQAYPEWMPERPTKKQQQWRPGKTTRPRSTFVMLTSSVLMLEAVLVLFATLATWGLTQKFYGEANRGFALVPVDESMRPAVILYGVFLGLLLIATCAFMRKKWGVIMGWVDQVLIISCGILMTPMFFIGVAFAICWWYAIRLGRRIDKDNGIDIYSSL